MSKPRDYKAEHARRTIVWATKQLGGQVSFWRVSNYRALIKILPQDEVKELIDKREIPDRGLFQLLEIARRNPAAARQLLKSPDKIERVYKAFKPQIDEARPKRVDAATRIDRAWQAYWNRWLQKFDPEDWQFVRSQCAHRISEELEQEDIKQAYP